MAVGPFNTERDSIIFIEDGLVLFSEDMIMAGINLSGAFIT